MRICLVLDSASPSVRTILYVCVLSSICQCGSPWTHPSRTHVTLDLALFGYGGSRQPSIDILPWLECRCNTEMLRTCGALFSHGRRNRCKPGPNVVFARLSQ